MANPQTTPGQQTGAPGLGECPFCGGEATTDRDAWLNGSRVRLLLEEARALAASPSIPGEGEREQPGEMIRSIIRRLYGIRRHFSDCVCVTCEDARMFLEPAASQPAEPKGDDR